MGAIIVGVVNNVTTHSTRHRLAQAPWDAALGPLMFTLCSLWFSTTHSGSALLTLVLHYSLWFSTTHSGSALLALVQHYSLWYSTAHSGSALLTLV